MASWNDVVKPSDRSVRVGEREQGAQRRRPLQIRPGPPREIRDPLGDFSEQTGAQFG